MKSVCLIAFCLTVAYASTLGNPDNNNKANIRAEKSLPTANDVDVAKPTEAVKIIENKNNSTAFESQGYVYKSVRRQRFRMHRDVSHLNHEYLPPVASIHIPSMYYLPPIEPVRTILKPNNHEYLTPLELETEEQVTATTEEPITTTMIITTTEDVTESPRTQAPIAQDLIDDTSILEEDGYHYRKPDIVPDLTPVREYLPPLEDGSVEVEHVSFDESATLNDDDGYRYRAIRNFRF